MRRWSPLVVAIAVLTTLSSTAVAQTTSSLEQQLDQREQQREEVRERLDESRAAEETARERLEAADRHLDAVTAELAAVEVALEEALAERDRARAEAHRLRGELAEVEQELAEAEAELTEARDRLGARAAGAYKRGATATEAALVTQIIAADDISEALSTAPFLTAVLDADRRIVTDVRDLVADVQRQRGGVAALRVSAEREAQQAAAQAEEVTRRVEDQRRLTAEVESRRVEREAALEALRDDRASIESHLAGLDVESSRLSDQLAAIAAQQAAEAERAAREAREAREAAEAEERRRAAARDADRASDAGGTPSTPGGGNGSGDGGSGSSGGGGGGGTVEPPPSSNGSWTRPVGGSVTSPFGPRWGRNHNGVDLAGAVGTTVVAARAGTVVSVTTGCHPTSSFGCGGGFGNHVVISHDGGMATVSAHLSTVSVGSGQRVSAGQAIGAVGNSGNSYGAHLHFEVREAGTPRNPCGYITC